MVLFGSTVLIPQFLQVLLGYTAERAGMVLSPAGFVMMVMMFIAGRTVGKMDPAPAGLASATSSPRSASYNLTRLDLDVSFAQVTLWRMFQVMGLPFIFIPISTLNYVGVPRDKTNQISVLSNFARNLGGSPGTALLTTFLARSSQVHQQDLGQPCRPRQPRLQRLHGADPGRPHAPGAGRRAAARSPTATPTSRCCARPPCSATRTPSSSSRRHLLPLAAAVPHAPAAEGHEACAGYRALTGRLADSCYTHRFSGGWNSWSVQTMAEIRRIGVVGAGTMGNGIAHVFARSGLPVVLAEVEQPALDRGLSTIEKNLGREVAKGKLTQADADAARARITGTLDRKALAGCDLVVEAATERFAIKQALFQELDGLLAPEAILASNTSSISITKLAATTKRPDRVIGMHFFNPVPVMQLVEVIRGLQTSQATFDAVKALSERLGKTPVEVNDAAGFVSNRVLMPLLNEAMFAVMEGVATPEAIDKVFQLGMAHPMGPLTLADFIGLDVCLDIMRVLEEGIGDPKYRPCPLLIRMVDAGWKGRKSGKGFFEYPQK